MSDTDPDHFEMRKLESLSNTIFGVAMTLLAYDLPKTGQFKGLPTWTDLNHRGSRAVVLLNLFFLLSIILLPVTNGLYGNYPMSSPVTVLYGAHLTVIAGLNAWLWWLATRDVRSPALISAVFPVLVFLPSIAIAIFAPKYVQYFWFLAFGALFVRRFVGDQKA